MATQDSSLAVAINDIATIKGDIAEIKSDFKSFRTFYVTHEEFAPIKKDYVKRDEFTPIKNLVYGFTGLILTTVVGGMIYMLMNYAR